MSKNRYMNVHNIRTRLKRKNRNKNVFPVVDTCNKNMKDMKEIKMKKK